MDDVVSNIYQALDEGMFVSKFEYFRVIYLVCAAVDPGRAMDARQMALDYNRDRGSGTIVSKKRFLESIFEVRQCRLTPC